MSLKGLFVSNRYYFSRLLLARGVFAPILFCGVAQAGVFKEEWQQRHVSIGAEISAFNTETYDSSSATFDNTVHGVSGDLNMLALGMDISTAEGNCFGQGVSSQRLVIGENSIGFAGLADINVGGIPSFPYMIEGSGRAVVQLKYEFYVASTQSVRLEMSSQVDMFKDENYIFSLSNQDGVVWGQTAVVSESGTTQRSFERILTFLPGRYSLMVDLSADSRFTDSFGYAGRTSVSFSISAVPEASTFEMFVVGVLMSGIMLSRKKSDREGVWAC